MAQKQTVSMLESVGYLCAILIGATALIGAARPQVAQTMGVIRALSGVIALIIIVRLLAIGASLSLKAQKGEPPTAGKQGLEEETAQ